MLPQQRRINEVFRSAEQRSERLLAYLRVAALSVLLLLFSHSPFFGHHQSLNLSLAIYGSATAIAFLAAFGHRQRPWLIWVMTTFDVALVLHYMGMVVLVGGRSPLDGLAAPGTLLIYLVLSYGALRYRPALIVYAASLFLAGWAGLHLASEAGAGFHILHYGADEIARIAILAMTAFLLALASGRGRMVLLESIMEAELRSSLARFVPGSLVSELAEHGLGAAAPRIRNAAVLFVDLRGFTSACEGISPSEVLQFLSDYRKRVSGAILEHAGTIDKFIGDAVMAVFGLLEVRPSDAANAVAAGFAILETIEGWNRERQQAGEAPVRVGIGIHYGEVVVGAIGDGQRLEYTVIGDTVNVAQRIERICSSSGESFVVSREVLVAADIAPFPLRWRPLPFQALRGREMPLDLFAAALPHASEPRPGMGRPEDGCRDHEVANSFRA